MSARKRIVLKISGESLASLEHNPISPIRITWLAEQALHLVDQGIETAVVVGGGNHFRGSDSASILGIARTEADNIGMLGTVVNGIVLRDRIANISSSSAVRLMTAIPIPSMAEPYIRPRADRHLSRGKVVIIAAGNGQPFVTTDYPSVQRAVELEADMLLLAKNGVDGVYTGDPKLDSSAQFLQHLTYDFAIDNRVKVMDDAAFFLAKEHSLPLVVFDANLEGSIHSVITGQCTRTVISG
jgi:uridylate kinase